MEHMTASVLASPMNQTTFPARQMEPHEAAAWHWEITPESSAEHLQWLLLRWRVDPVCFAVEALRIILQPYQIAILLDLADAPRAVYDFYGIDSTRHKRQVLVPSGHGLGKTRLEAVAAWWHPLTHLFSKTLITAPTSDQITGQLMGEVRKLYRRLKTRWPDLVGEWEILTDSIRHKDPANGDWGVFGRTSRQEKPESMQGAHALDVDDEYGQLAALFEEEIERMPAGGMLVIIEEGSGVPDIIRETLTGALSEPGARLLTVGNPTRPDGWFATDMDKPHRYAIHTLDCRMSDNTKEYRVPYRDFGGDTHQLKIRGFVEPRYWQDILSDCDGDEEHDRVRVRVRGRKPRSAFEQCLRANWIEAAQARLPDRESIAEPAIIGLDFGLFADKHALAVRQGFNVRDVAEWLPRETPDEITLEAARRAIDAQEIFKAKFIIGDSNGVGRGAMEYLSGHFADRPQLNVTVIHFNSGFGAIDRKRFYRRRDEMWFKAGRAFFSDPRCTLPDAPGVKRQLCAPGFHEDASRRIQVETKDQIQKRTGQPSGNAADAVLQTLLVETQPVLSETPAKQPDHPQVFEDHFQRWQNKQYGESGVFIR